MRWQSTPTPKIRCIDSIDDRPILRVLEVQEIKTVPYVSLSHPFVERLIGTVRREYLDRTLFWTTDGWTYLKSDSAPVFAAGALQRANRGANTLPLFVRHHDIRFIKLQIIGQYLEGHPKDSLARRFGARFRPRLRISS
jgi:hypothetical protein